MKLKQNKLLKIKIIMIIIRIELIKGIINTMQIIGLILENKEKFIIHYIQILFVNIE